MFSGNSRSAAMALVAAAMACSLTGAQAADITWSGTTGDYNTASNWIGGVLPGSSDTAIFNSSASTTSLSFSTFLNDVGGWTFQSGAYQFSNAQEISFYGAGITVDSGASASITNYFSLDFYNTSTAGSASITNNFGMTFLDASTAGSASITNDNLTVFSGTSTAGSASITNNLFLAFLNTSTAGNASITNNSGGTTYIEDTASGGTANFIMNGTGALDISGLTSSGTAAGSIAGDGKVFLGSKTLAVGISNLSSTFSGVIADGGTFGGTGGSVELAGGTLIVTGTSSIGGTVTIDPGATLQWGDGTTFAWLWGAGNAVTDNGSLVIDFGGSGVGASIPISGTGSVTLQSGSLNDSAVSTYSGATTIDTGTVLLLSGSGSISNSSAVTDNGTFDIASTTAGTAITSLSGSGLVSLGSKTLTLSNASGVFSGVLADDGIFDHGTGGSLTIAAGTETLTGNNTFTGTTTIDPGATLQLGDGTSANGSVAGAIVDNGLLKFDYAGSQTLANAVSGSGSAEIVAGTTAVTGFGIVGGTVSIDPGATMQWGNGSGGAFLFGSDVVDNGALVMDFSTAAGIVGSVPISGSGTVHILSGNFTSSSPNTYTGSTTIDSPSQLLLVGTGSISDSSSLTDDGTFDISGTTAGTAITTLSGSGLVSLGSQTLTLTNASGIFSGVIADGGFPGGTGGSLTIAAGSETLNGVNTYTGATTIDSGAALAVGDASHPGAVLDSSVGGVLVNSGGTLKGHGTINGAVTNNGTVIAGGSIGTLTVGSFSQGPNGTLAIEVSPTQASQLKSLGAASLDGTLALTFDPGSYSAAIDQIITGSPVTGTFANVTASGSPGIAYGISYSSTGVDLVTETTTNAQVYGGVSVATLDQARGLARTVEGRLNDCGDGSSSSCQDIGVWVKGFASGDQLDSRGGYLGLHNTTSGVIGGIDKNWADASSLGVAFSYGYDTLHMGAASSKASGASYFAALYGRLVDGETWFDGQAFYMHNDWSVRRSISGYGTATSNPGGDTEGVLLEASTAIETPDLRPYLQGAYVHFHRQSATETGVGPLGYVVSSDSSNLGYVEAGIRFAHSYTLDNGDAIRPSVGFGVQQNFGDMTQSVIASLSGLSGTGFAVDAAKMDGVAAVADASLDFALTPNFDLTVDLQGHVGNSHTEGMALIGGAFRF